VAVAVAAVVVPELAAVVPAMETAQPTQAQLRQQVRATRRQLPAMEDRQHPQRRPLPRVMGPMERRQRQRARQRLRTTAPTEPLDITDTMGTMDWEWPRPPPFGPRLQRMASLERLRLRPPLQPRQCLRTGRKKGFRIASNAM